MVVEDKDVPGLVAAIEEARERVNEALNPLDELLADHDEDCVYRCFRLNCDQQHSCEHPLHEEVG